MNEHAFWQRICRMTGETEEQAKARILRETQETHGKGYLRLRLDLTMQYMPEDDSYWLRSASPANVEVQHPDGSWGEPVSLTDPDGEHPGINWKFSARPGSGYYNIPVYARLAKLADEQGVVHGPVPSMEEIENMPTTRLRDRGYFRKCPSCGYERRQGG